MHDGDGEAEQCAAQHGHFAATNGRYPQCDRTAGDGEQQRYCGQLRLIGDFDPWLIGDHRYEMRTPDGRARRNAPHEAPCGPGTVLVEPNALEQADRYRRTDQAKQGSDADEPQVMFVRKTDQKTQNRKLPLHKG